MSRAIDSRGLDEHSIRKIEFWYETKGILNSRADVTLFGMKWNASAASDQEAIADAAPPPAGECADRACALQTARFRIGTNVMNNPPGNGCRIDGPAT